MHQLLRNSRWPVPRRRLLEELGCSRATITRIIEDLRDFLGAPLEYSREANGYYYANDGEHPYELPGLWFNASELYALLAAQQLLVQVKPGLLESHLNPLRKRIDQILLSERLVKGDVGRRVRILAMASRPQNRHFALIANALLQRKQIHIDYHGRSRNVRTSRDVSPQRLTHYRDNWYLDAWCHRTEALRSFSLDRIDSARSMENAAAEIPEVDLNAHFAVAYGIFAGPPTHRAILRFTPECARWVADEQWHPEQTGRYVDGYYELEVPYSDPRELIMDVLKWGPGVEVIGPHELRQEVMARLRDALARYKTR